MLHDVYYFNRFVLGMQRAKPQRLTAPERGWLDMALREEIDELLASKSLEEDVDALIDLIYFAIGGLYRLGLSEDQALNAFQIVHEVNMQKRIGIKETRPQSGTVADAVKPEGLPDPLVEIRRMFNERTA